MFTNIARFEFFYQLKSPVFWVSAFVFFLLAFGSVASSRIQIGAPGNTNINAPFAIVITLLVMSIFSLFLIAAFVANVVVRDDDTGYGPIIRSTRVTKFDYLFGRFTGAFLASALAFASVPLGLFAGIHMPWIDQERLGPIVLQHYALAYAVYALPTLFVVSALLFAVAAIVRSMTLTYLGVIVLFVLYAISGQWLSDLKNEQLAALLDPFGFGPVTLATKYWTASDRNTMFPPLDGLVVENRLIWLAVAFVFLALAYSFYRFTERSQRRSSKKTEDAAPIGAYVPVNVQPRFDAAALRAQTWKWTRFEMAQVVKSPAFFILLLLGVANAISAVWVGTSLDDWTLLPVTRLMIENVGAAFAIAPVLIAAYYAGELVWRERERKSHELFGATPTPDWVFVAPKILAIAFVLALTLLVSIAVAIGVQMFKGYSNFEFGKYVVWYALPTFIGFLHLAVMAVFLQAIAPHKFVGWGLMGLYIVARNVISNLGYEHKLYLYGASGGVPLSDMSGQSYFWIGRTWFELYWSAIALILILISFAIWPRGTEARYRPRLAKLYRRLRGPAGSALAFALAIALTSGTWIFYNTNILNAYRTTDQIEKLQADAERALLKFEHQPQPRIIGVALNVALYPADARAATAGDYLIENRTAAPLTEVHINLPEDLTIQSLEIDGARLDKTLEDFNYRIYKFDQPMAAGERRHIRFKTVLQQQGFKNSGNQTAILENGTFLNNLALAPVIGTHRNNFLQDPTARRRQGLPAELRMPKLEDKTAGANSYLRPDSDWVASDITVSTIEGQTPIAPGYVVSDETKNGRRTVHFKSDSPIQNFYSIQSARYAIKQQKWNGIDLAVYYHPEHAFNVDLMLSVMKTSLDLYAREFGPYQFRQARIIEFPAIAVFAQSFANTIAYSEDIGFLQDAHALAADPSKIDMVTYVTAHEIAHQWWAHQVLGADVQGSTMLSESFASYSALLVMEKMYGPEQVRKFLNQERDRYLQGRLGETVEEQPLVRVENQQYIHYRKGAMVLYRLKTELGAGIVNRSLMKLVDQFKFRTAPYPRSTDFLNILRAEAGPAHAELIADLFEKITLYELKAKSVKVAKRADGKFDVAIEIETKKFYADGEGKQTDAPMQENVPVGAFLADPSEPGFDRAQVLAYEMRPVKTGTQTITLVTAKPPKFVAVDPYSIWIDRDDKDNIIPADAPAS
ncbi:MAG: aminopeptidase [Alphaproteobacteria bacterium]|nr:aminopeptidase [Alphaproteobacteria bacterium]